MAQNRFQPNRKGIEAFLKSAEMQTYLGEISKNVANRAGPGFGAQVNVGKDRARGTVMAETTEAKLSQARNHDIERAIGGGM